MGSLAARVCFALLVVCACAIAEEPIKPLVAFNPSFDVSLVSLNKASARIFGETADTMVFELKGEANADHPSANMAAPGGNWDLSPYKGVEAVVTNASATAVKASLRIDNAGDQKDSPWNIEQLTIEPNQTKVIRVTFGQSDGAPGYALDPHRVVRFVIAAVQPKGQAILRVQSVRPFGSSGNAPKASETTVNGKAATPESAPAGSLIDFSSASDRLSATPASQVKFQTRTDAGKSALLVTIEPGQEKYPGVRIKAPGQAWDLSAFGHVDARVTNTGKVASQIALRIDNAGQWQSEPYNTESTKIAPGQTATIRVIFGYSFGKKPGYALKSNAVVGALVFAQKSPEIQSFRIESITAGGKAGEKP